MVFMVVDKTTKLHGCRQDNKTILVELEASFAAAEAEVWAELGKKLLPT